MSRIQVSLLEGKGVGKNTYYFNRFANASISAFPPIS